MDLRSKIEAKRRRSLQKIGKIVIGLIAIPVVLQAIMTDIKIVGVQDLWIYLRVGIIPIGVAALLSYKLTFIKKFPFLPVIGVVLYIAGFHLYFVSQTGYSNSIYFHSYIQLMFGITMIPLSRKIYFLTTTLIVGAYSLLILNHANFDFGVFSSSNVIFLKTYLIIAIATFLVINRAHERSYEKEALLEEEIEKRDSIIENKAEELSKAKINLINEEAKANHYKSLGKLASQVSHNIRSPLGTMDILANNAQGIPDEVRGMLREAINKIRTVANKLLKSKPHELVTKDDDIRFVSLCSIVENIVEEKQILYSGQDVSLESNVMGLNKNDYIVEVEPVELYYVISNLINNSFEALDGSGKVSLTLSKGNSKIGLEIADDGCGIPEDALQIIQKGQMGFSYMKPNGSGIGIHHAKTSIENWGGKFEIDSIEGKGTIATIELKSVEIPKDVHVLEVSPSHMMV